MYASNALWCHLYIVTFHYLPTAQVGCTEIYTWLISQLNHITNYKEIMCWIWRLCFMFRLYLGQTCCICRLYCLCRLCCIWRLCCICRHYFTWDKQYMFPVVYVGCGWPRIGQQQPVLLKAVLKVLLPNKPQKAHQKHHFWKPDLLIWTHISIFPFVL